HRLVDRPRAFLSEPGAEARSVDVRHYEKDQTPDPRSAVDVVDAVNRDDVGMAQLRRRLGLANEPSAHVRVEREVRRENLDRYRSMEPQIRGAIYHRHAAAPDLAIDQ